MANLIASISNKQIVIEVPQELSKIGGAVQGFIQKLHDGSSWMIAVSEVLPQLFAAGAVYEEVKEEAKNPQAIVLAAVVAAQIVVLLMEQKAQAAALAKHAVAPVALAPKA